MCGVAVVPERDDSVRTAEVIAALCLATDLGMAFPFEHGLHTTLIAMRLADRLGVDRRTASETYYASLLSHAGCTTEAHIAAEVFGGSLTTNLNPVMYGSTREVVTGVLRALPDPGSPALVRFAQTARRLPRMAREQRPALSAACEVAGMLAERVGAPSSVPELLAQLTERWDGKGPLRRAKGEQIPLPMRIVHVATDAAFQCLLGGVEHAAHLVHERAGHAFDPEVAACCAEHASELLAIDEGGSSWDDVLAWEPSPQLALDGESVDRALGAMGELRRPRLSIPLRAFDRRGRAGGHGCSALRDRCSRCRDDPAGGVPPRPRPRCGPPRIWQKPGPLTADEWEQVRLHPYHTERVLSRSPFFSALCPIADAHHERLDGSGYHRGVNGSALGLPARLLAAADAYHAMTEPRPHRAPIPPRRLRGSSPRR